MCVLLPLFPSTIASHLPFQSTHMCVLLHEQTAVADAPYVFQSTHMCVLLPQKCTKYMRHFIQFNNMHICLVIRALPTLRHMNIKFIIPLPISRIDFVRTYQQFYDRFHFAQGGVRTCNPIFLLNMRIIPNIFTCVIVSIVMDFTTWTRPFSNR